MAQEILIKNNAVSTLLAGITSGALSLSVQAGHGARFDSPGSGQIAKLTLSNSAGLREIVHVTARSGDTLTIVRAQEGTTARAWNAGDAVEQTATAAFLNGLSQLDRTETVPAQKTFADLVVSGPFTSTKVPTESGFLRVTPNMCRIPYVLTLTALTRDAITSLTGPTGAKGLILRLRNVVKSNNSVGLRSSTTTVYLDSGATASVARHSLEAYEQVAISAGSTLVSAETEVHIFCNNPTGIWLQFVDDSGNQGAAEYKIVGYYD